MKFLKQSVYTLKFRTNILVYNYIIYNFTKQFYQFKQFQLQIIIMNLKLMNLTLIVTIIDKYNYLSIIQF